MALSDHLNNSLSLNMSNELLRYLLERDNLSLDGVVIEMKKKRKEQILQAHPYEIFQSKDGRYRTYVKDSSLSTGRRMIAKSTLQKLEDALVEYYEATNNSDAASLISLSMLYPDWIRYKALHVEATTIDRVKKDWKRYYADSEIINKPIRQITKLELDEWIHSMIRQYCMDKHQYGNFSLIIRQELQYAVDRGIINDNLFNYVHVDKKRVLRQEHKKTDETQVFSVKELDGICACAEKDYVGNKRPKHKLAPLAVVFLFQTGIRLGEVSALKFEDVLDDEIIIRRTVRYPRGEIMDSTKGTYGDRLVPLTPKAINIINIAKCTRKKLGLSDEEYIFCLTDEPIHTYLAIQKAFSKYCKDLGIVQRGPHKARKTYISQLLDEGININTVRRIAGHMDEQTTLNNYCYDMKSKAERQAQVIAAIH